VLSVLDAALDRWLLRGARIAVQEYGVSSPELVAGLSERGAHVLEVPVYRWTLPENLSLLETAVRAIVDDGIDVVLLTAPVQLLHLLEVAERMGLTAALRRGLQRLVIASIGPMTSEEIVRQGLTAGLEASNAKMGVLVKEAAEQWQALLRARRSLESTA
jgi:uroporphyrinogen-III synthase